MTRMTTRELRIALLGASGGFLISGIVHADWRLGLAAAALGFTSMMIGWWGQ